MVWTDFGSSSVPFARPVRCSLISSFPLHLRLVARTLFCCLCSCAAHARCWPLLFFFLCPFCYCPICTHKCLIAHSSRGCVTRSSLAQIPLTCSMGCSPGLVSTALCDPGKGTQQCGNICKVRKENSASGRSLRLTQSLNCAHNISTHAIGIALTATASEPLLYIYGLGATLSGRLGGGLRRPSNEYKKSPQKSEEPQNPKEVTK